jgi:hypothetical protein
MAMVAFATLYAVGTRDLLSEERSTDLLFEKRRRACSLT